MKGRELVYIPLSQSVCVLTLKSMTKEKPKSIQVHLNGRDHLEFSEDQGKSQFRFIGCHELNQFLTNYRQHHGDNIKSWPLPEGLSHSELLLKELLLKIKGQWNFPYQADELCHCRCVPTAIVDQAILAGAHTPEAVSRWTSASTACGTCRSDVEKMINYRLGLKDKVKA